MESITEKEQMKKDLENAREQYHIYKEELIYSPITDSLKRKHLYCLKLKMKQLEKLYLKEVEEMESKTFTF